MTHSLGAVSAAPQLQPATVQTKERNLTCTRQRVEQIMALQIPEAINFQSIHSFLRDVTPHLD